MKIAGTIAVVVVVVRIVVAVVAVAVMTVVVVHAPARPTSDAVVIVDRALAPPMVVVMVVPVVVAVVDRLTPLLEGPVVARPRPTSVVTVARPRRIVDSVNE